MKRKTFLVASVMLTFNVALLIGSGKVFTIFAHGWG